MFFWLKSRRVRLQRSTVSLTVQNRFMELEKKKIDVTLIRCISEQNAGIDLSLFLYTIIVFLFLALLKTRIARGTRDKLSNYLAHF